MHRERGGLDEGKYKVLHNIRQFRARDVDGLFDRLADIETGLQTATEEFCDDTVCTKHVQNAVLFVYGACRA